MKNYVQYTIHSRSSVDLSVYNCGWQKCRSDHSFGPRINDFFLIHFLLGGKGVFQVGSKTYPIERGQAFIIYPSDYYMYKADEDDPYEYLWVGFHGTIASALVDKTPFSRDTPVVEIPNLESFSETIQNIIACSRRYTEEKNLEALGHLYILISHLISQNIGQSNSHNPLSSYIIRTVQYIHDNYQNDITITDLCRLVSLNRTYFSTIFKNHMKIAPYDYLINYRIDQACNLLTKTTLPVSEISSMVGFRDPINFSLRFKKIVGKSPSAYRKSNYDNDEKIPL